MTFRVSLFEGFSDKHPAPLELSWDELAEMLTSRIERAAKDGLAWSPASYPPGLERFDTNVTELCALIFDFDRLETLEALAPAASKLESFAHIVYTTHSHKPDRPKLRLVLPLSSPIPPGEYAGLGRAVAQAFEFPPYDPTSHTISQVHYLPSRPPEAEGHFESAQQGPFLNPADYPRIAAAPVRSRFAPPPVNGESPADTSEPVAYDLGAALDRIAKVIQTKCRSRDNKQREIGELLRRCKKGEALFVAGREDEIAAGRDHALQRLVSTLVHVIHPPPPWHATLELIRPCLNATDLTPEGFDHWALEAEDMYGRAMDRRAQWDEERKLQAERNRALWSGRPRASNPDPVAEGEEEGTPSEDPDAWMGELVLSGKDEDGTGADLSIRPNGHNIGLILANHPVWKNAIWWDDVRREIVIERPAPGAGLPAKEAATAILNWFSSPTAGLGLELRQSDLERQISLAARNRSRDRVSEYLAGLEWDGVERIDRFLIDAVAAEDNTYTRLVSRRWFVSAAARGLVPGTKVDTVLILEGAQGAKKSTLFETLAGEFFTSSPIQPGEKDSEMKIARVWIAEMAELNSVRFSDIERVKQFLSERISSFRPPFGAAVEDFPRRCACVGTYNPKPDSPPFSDPTGSRRFWPVTVYAKEIDIAKVKRERDQLWAEAVHVYRDALSCDACAERLPTSRCADHRWWFDADEWKSHGESVIAERTRDDSLEIAALIEQRWCEIEPNRRERDVRAIILARDFLDIAPKDFAREQVKIYAALRHLGFVQSRMRENQFGSNKLRTWRAPDDLMTAHRPRGLLRVVRSPSEGDGSGSPVQ